MLQTDPAGAERKGKRPFPYEEERNDDADRLGNDSRERRTGTTHAQSADQKKVAEDVGHGGNHDGHEWSGGISDAPENGSQHVVGDNHDGAGTTNLDVAHRLRERFLRSVHEPGEVSGDKRHDDGQNDADSKEEDDACADDVATGLLVAFTDLLSEVDGRPHGKADNQVRHGCHQLGADGDS